jgi:hypothetical protein
MRRTLTEMGGEPVLVVEAFVRDWIRAGSATGWKRILDTIQRTVCEAVSDSRAGRVVLVGHSAGGVVSRLYLSPKPFLGVECAGVEHVDCLITLGSPHHNRRATRMRQWVDEVYPGAYFAPGVDYVSVAGRAVQGRRDDSLRERAAYLFYERLCGDGNTWGDGLVPVPSALLRGSRQIVRDRVSHFTGFGGPWYGDDRIIPKWWSVAARVDEPD